MRYAPDRLHQGGAAIKHFFSTAWMLLTQTYEEWSRDKAPQLGAALAYYTVFSLAPLVLLIVALVGLLFRDDPSGAWTRITQQMGQALDQSAVDVVEGIAREAAKPGKSVLATIIGVALALFGAAGVFGQLQDALNTIWGVKMRPGLGIRGFVRARLISFGMVGGICFLLLVSLVVESLLKAFSEWVEAMLPGGIAVAVSIYLVVDFAVVVCLFAMIFKVLPDVEIRWRDVWVGALLTAVLFLIGKWALGLYLGSGTAASAYGAASALITFLIWIYYSSQILLFGAEFTQVFARYSGAAIVPSSHAMEIDAR